MNKKTNIPSRTNYYIKPGFLYVAIEPTTISAVLGSCVSVCLFDNKQKAGGMNNFLWPSVFEKNKATAKYGNIATRALIRMMIRNGSKKKDLEAQIFGGAFNKDISPKDIGKLNVKIAKKTLKDENIPITSEDTGGEKGRKLVFDTSNNEIAVVRVDNLRQNDWHPYESE